MSNIHQGVEPGFWVAVSLRKNSAPLRCYVGKVVAVDTAGVRLTLIDWLIGTASGHDLFLSWASITTALIATPEDDLGLWIEAAKDWQGRIERIGKKPDPFADIPRLGFYDDSDDDGEGR